MESLFHRWGLCLHHLLSRLLGRDPELSPPPEDSLELVPPLEDRPPVDLHQLLQDGFDWQELPLGQLCDWQGPSFEQQLHFLHRLITVANREHRRCAIIDIAHQLNSLRWQFLVRSGVNWLVPPDDITAAVRAVEILLVSQQFPLVVIVGLGMEDLDPAEVTLLQSVLSPWSIVIFLQFTPPWDTPGEPLPLPQTQDRILQCA